MGRVSPTGPARGRHGRSEEDDGTGGGWPRVDSISRRSMPNWCECDLEISGPTATVRRFLEFAEGGDGEEGDTARPSPFHFTRFSPYPREWGRMAREAEAFRERWKTLPPDERERTPRP